MSKKCYFCTYVEKSILCEFRILVKQSGIKQTFIFEEFMKSYIKKEQEKKAIDEFLR
jgi:hypothetical protein